MAIDWVPSFLQSTDTSVVAIFSVSVGKRRQFSMPSTSMSLRGCPGLRPGCVSVASRLRPGCVLVTSLRGAPPIFHLRLFINKNCVIILKPVISFKSVFPRKITFSSKHPVYQRSKIIGRGLFILRGQQGHICIHTCLNIRRRRETWDIKAQQTN